MKKLIFLLLTATLTFVCCQKGERILLKDNLMGPQHLGIPVADMDSVKAWYSTVLGFAVVHEPVLSTPQGDIRVAFLRKNDLTIELYQLTGPELEEIKTRDHGHIDHFAIDVLDVNAAARQVSAQGAQFEASTAQGPVANTYVWPKGTHYLNLNGPMKEKVQLSQRMDLDPGRRVENIDGWSHLGIPVTDLVKAKKFYRQFGFIERWYVEIPKGDGVQPVSMMEKDGLFIELYQPWGPDRQKVAERKDGHIDHIAFTVKDIDRAFQEVKKAGLETMEEAPVSLPFWDNGIKYFNIRGPNGEKLEFSQIL
jgi:catechol 2,3-dioxygenase-like lactoylglutathione lyase family enzyme